MKDFTKTSQLKKHGPKAQKNTTIKSKNPILQKRRHQAIVQGGRGREECREHDGGHCNWPEQHVRLHGHGNMKPETDTGVQQ